MKTVWGDEKNVFWGMGEERVFLLEFFAFCYCWCEWGM